MIKEIHLTGGTTITNQSDMTELDEYQEFVASCPQPKDDNFKAYWASTQMVCEAAEVLEIFEKAYRKDKTVDPDKVLDELGDVVWGVAAICNAMGLTLDGVIEHNIAKLKARYEAAK